MNLRTYTCQQNTAENQTTYFQKLLLLDVADTQSTINILLYMIAT